MPIYDYKCAKHGEFQKNAKIAERDQVRCPKCDRECERLISAPRGINGGYYDTVTRVS